MLEFANPVNRGAVQLRMPISIENVRRTIRKLRKILNELREDACAEEVHTLRTHTRRVEAVAAALMMDRRRSKRGLLKVLKRLRKSAGKVRDADVFLEKALVLQTRGDSEGAARLVEYLGGVRRERAREFDAEIAKERKDARKRLKRLSKRVREWQDDGTETTASALRLVEKIRDWPTRDAESIHRFRIEVKKLRYVLQLEEQPEVRLVTELGKVKDLIGEWHDWLELRKIAEEVPGTGIVLREIGIEERAALKEAMAAGNELRRSFRKETIRRDVVETIGGAA